MYKSSGPPAPFDTTFVTRPPPGCAKSIFILGYSVQTSRILLSPSTNTTSRVVTRRPCSSASTEITSVDFKAPPTNHSAWGTFNSRAFQTWSIVRIGLAPGGLIGAVNATFETGVGFDMVIALRDFLSNSMKLIYGDDIVVLLHVLGTLTGLFIAPRIR